MLKRVVRRALKARTEREAPKPPQRAAPSPRPRSVPPTPPKPSASPLTGIAARIAAGKTETPTVTVTATSGNTAPVAGGVTTNERGEAYWGDTDNESARARANGDTLIIDQWECISCGTCVENTDRVFVLPDDAKATVIVQEGNMVLIQDAIDACPVTCIHWTDNPTEFEQINDADGGSDGLAGP
jgi:ferredoxin